jgi:hypothetical protein
MSSSAANAAAGLSLDPEFLKFQQSISSSPKLSGVTVSSNVLFDNVEVLKSSDGYELWSQNMSVIFEAMVLYDILVSGIDPSTLTSAVELITFELVQQQGLLVIIQVVYNEILGKIAKLKTPHDMWIYLWMSYRRDSPLSYVVALRSFMCIEQRISPAKVSPSEFISAFEIEWNLIAHLSPSCAAGFSTYRKIVKDLFVWEEVNRNFLLVWVAESYDNVVENVSSKAHLT